MNIITILILGGVVYYAMTNKSKNTRNLLLLVAGLLFFCMMNKEGFTLPAAGAIQSPADTGPTYTFSDGGAWDQSQVSSLPTPSAGLAVAPALGVSCVGTEDSGKVAPWTVKWLGEGYGESVGENPLDETNISTIWGCEGSPAPPSALETAQARNTDLERQLAEAADGCPEDCNTKWWWSEDSEFNLERKCNAGGWLWPDDYCAAEKTSEDQSAAGVL